MDGDWAQGPWLTRGVTEAQAAETAQRVHDSRLLRKHNEEVPASLNPPPSLYTYMPSIVTVSNVRESNCL